MLLQKSRKRRRSTSAASSAAGSASAAKAKPSLSAPSATASSAPSSAPSSPPPPPPSPPPPVFQEEEQEDPLFPLVDFNFVDDSLVNFYRSRWSSIRSHHRSGRIQTTHNIRLTNLDTTTLQPTLWKIFRNQSSAFKINLSFGFILRNKISGELRYFHSSKNVSGRFLDVPHLVNKASDFQSCLDSFYQQDILSWALLQRPNSEWICDLVTNFI